MNRYFAFLLIWPSAVLGQSASDPVERDQYGCAIIERPAHLTFSTFQDGWRTLAADKLYALRRHQAVIEAGDCDCSILRPDWATIDTEFDNLGFRTGPSSSYRKWSASQYHPQVSDLRQQVAELCEEAE